jgi:hypothetical protein
MAGQVVRILQETLLDATGLAAGANSIIVIARRMDVARWRELIIIGRLHSPLLTGAQVVDVQVQPDGYTDEDPGANWNFTGGAGSLMQFSSGDAVPNVKFGNVGNVLGSLPPLIMLLVKFTQAGAGASLKPLLSIDACYRGE